MGNRCPRTPLFECMTSTNSASSFDKLILVLKHGLAESSPVILGIFRPVLRKMYRPTDPAMWAPIEWPCVKTSPVRLFFIIKIQVNCQATGGYGEQKWFEKCITNQMNIFQWICLDNGFQWFANHATNTFCVECRPWVPGIDKFCTVNCLKIEKHA